MEKKETEMKNRLLKTFTSLVLTALMVISVMPAFAITIGAAEGEQTCKLNFASTDNRTSYDTAQQVWEENGITFTNDKANSSSNVADYSNPVRLYAKSKVTITCGGNITKIVANCNTTSYATALKNSITETNTATVSGKVVTIIPSSSGQSYTIESLSAKVFLDSIEVTYKTSGGSETECEHVWEKTSSKAATCTEAGYDEYTCSKCGKTEQRTTEAALGHDEVTNDAQAATCTSVGWDAYVTCTRCDYTTYKEIAALGHTFVDGECTECGKKAPSYTLIDLADIQSTDRIVIVATMSNGTSYAISNDKGASAAPTAVKVTISGNILTTDATNILWNISKDGDNLTIYLDGTTETWLYCTNTNNGVRVGTKANKVFTIDATTSYLKNTDTSRYLGVYIQNPDWRCYDKTTGNIADQTFSFYKLVGCEHTNQTLVSDKIPATCTTDGKETLYTCDDCGALIGGDVIPAKGHTWGDDNVCDVCGGVPHTIPEVLASNDGTAVVVCGTVKKINTTWSDTHKNISVTIVDADGNELYIYRLATKVEIGDIIRVTGTKTTYNGTKEIAEGATAEIYGKTPVFSGVSLTLNKGVTVNVTLIIPDDWFYVGTAKVVFSNGESFVAIEGEKVYSVDLTPAQINDDLTVKITGAEGQILVADKDVSVSAYKAKAEAAGASTQLIALLDAALTYSNAADCAIEGELTETFTNVADPQIEHKDVNAKLLTAFSGNLGTYASIYIKVNTDIIEAGDTLSLLVGKVDISGDISEYITEDGQIVITGLFPANFDDEILVRATKTLTGNSSSATFTFNSYLKAIYNDDSSTRQVKNLAVATYLYGLKAEAYLATLQ